MKTNLSRRDFIRLTAIGAGVLALGGLGLKEILAEPGLKTYAETRALLGTFVTIKVVDTSENKARQAARDTFDEITRLSSVMSRFDSKSQLYALNTAGQVFGASSELVSVIKDANSYSELSRGTFDITVLPLLTLNQQSFEKYNTPPSQESIDETKTLVGYKNISIDGSDISLSKQGARVTLDGVAVGYIVDRAASLLKDKGSSQVLIDGGGELSLCGTRQDGNPWQIAITNPRDTGAYYEVLSITGKSIATSGDYQNFFTPDFRYNHIIDPGTGISPPELASVTVIARDTIRADALTKACFVMGRDEGMKFIESLPDAEALFIDKQMNGYRTGGFPKGISG